MLKKELCGVFKSRRQMIFIIIMIVLPIIDFILVYTHTTKWEYMMHPDAYLNPPPPEWLTHPALASFLSGSSRGHLTQMIYIWLMPLLILNIYSDGYISEYVRGYTNAILTRVKKRKYLMSKYLSSFIVPFCVVLVSLGINFALSLVMLHDGLSFQGLETLAERGGFFAFEINHPNINYCLYILRASIMAGLCGVMCQSLAFIFRGYKSIYFISFVIWKFLISLRDSSITYVFQPFIEYGLDYSLRAFVIFFVIVAVSVMAALITMRIRRDEI